MLERAVSGALAVSRRRAQALLAEGTLVRLRRGVVVGACVAERAAADARLRHDIRLRMMLLCFPDCVGSHESAALVRGLPLLDIPAWAIGTRTRGAWRGGGVMRIRVAPLPAHHLAVADTARCTTAPRTVVDIARSTSLRHATVVGDAALRGHCTRGELEQAFDDCSAWFDLGKARKALDFFDPRSESALESVSRVIIDERGLPLPTPQVEVQLDARTTYRVDFMWETQRVIGEADGLAKYDVQGALRAEKLRQERLERLGFTVVRWTWREMLVDTDETVARLRCALRC